MIEAELQILEGYAESLTQLMALLERLQESGELRYFDAGDFRALDHVRESLAIEIAQHKGNT